MASFRSSSQIANNVNSAVPEHDLTRSRTGAEAAELRATTWDFFWLCLLPCQLKTSVISFKTATSRHPNARGAEDRNQKALRRLPAQRTRADLPPSKPVSRFPASDGHRVS